MGWDDIEKLWNDSKIDGKESSISKDRVEDTGNIVDIYDIHTDKRTWSDVFQRDTIGIANVRL